MPDTACRLVIPGLEQSPAFSIDSSSEQVSQQGVKGLLHVVQAKVWFAAVSHVLEQGFLGDVYCINAGEA